MFNISSPMSEDDINRIWRIILTSRWSKKPPPPRYGLFEQRTVKAKRSGNKPSRPRVKNGSTFGADWTGRMCAAKTKSGKPCRQPAQKNVEFCRLHGKKMTSIPNTEISSQTK